MGLWLPFFFKSFRMTTTPPIIAAQIIFMGRQIILNTRNFKIIHSNQLKYKLNMMRYFCGSVFFQIAVVIRHAPQYDAIDSGKCRFSFF